MVLTADMKLLPGLFALMMAMAPLPAQAQEAKPRIAVLDFQGVGTQEAETAATTDRLYNELVNLHVFTVLERNQIEAVLQELALQGEGVTDQSDAVEMGKLLNVEYIIAGRIARLADGFQVNVKMIRVKTGEIVRSEAAVQRGDFIGLLANRMPAIAARLAQVEAPPPPVVLESSPPSPTETAPAPLPPWMGMMQGGKRTWALMMGGMMVLGAVVMGSRADGDHDGGHMSDAALAMGVIGAGLVTYYLLSEDTDPVASQGRKGDDPTRPRFFVAAGPDGIRAALGWRW